MKSFSVKDGKVKEDKATVRRPTRNTRSNEQNSTNRSSVTYRHEISPRSLLYLALFAAIFYFGFQLVQVFVVLFLSVVMTAGLLPFVRKLMVKGLNKVQSIALVYSVVIVILTVLLMLIILPFYNSIGSIQENWSDYSQEISNAFASIPFIQSSDSFEETQINDIVNNLFPFLTGSASNTISTVASLGAYIASFGYAIVLSIYIIADHDNFIELLTLRIIDERERELVKKFIFKIEDALGSWLVGQSILSVVIGSMTYIFLKVIGMPFALPLAVAAGLLETIPSIGPFLAAIPAIMIGGIESGFVMAIVIGCGFSLIQVLENNYIVPKIMGGAVGVKPIWILIGVFTGLSLFGVIGGLLAVPMIVLFQISYEFYKEYLKLRLR